MDAFRAQIIRLVSQAKLLRYVLACYTFSKLVSNVSGRQQYGMYVWTHGFDSYVDGCNDANSTALLQWNSSSECFTHTWETSEKREWLWDTCNKNGSEIGSIFVEDIKNHLKPSYLLSDCTSSDVGEVKQLLQEGHTQVQDLKIYALFSDSDEAVSEQGHIKYVVWYNDECATNSSTRFDGVAINNEAWAGIMCQNETDRERSYLNKLQNIKNETEKQVNGTLLAHYSTGYSWGRCDSTDYYLTWGNVTQKPTRHFIDIFDSVDIQVALVDADTIVTRSGYADYNYAVALNKSVFATSYANEQEDACTSTHFPDTDTCAYTWANSRKSEDYMLSMFDDYTAQIEITPCIHYFRGVYSSGGHPDWPSHWGSAPTSAPTSVPTLTPTLSPTLVPTAAPTLSPTLAPTPSPTMAPSLTPTLAPTLAPSVAPTSAPTLVPTLAPTVIPPGSDAPTASPTTLEPTLVPTLAATSQPTDYEPDPPVLSSAKFVSTGAKMTVTFDSPTDQGSTVGLLTEFTCADLFAFPGTSSHCEWTSSKMVTVYLASGSSVVPGDALTVAAGRLKARCTAADCSSWAYMGNGTATIATADAPVTPTLVLSYARTLGLCADLEVDASGSTGSGYAALAFGWRLLSAASAADAGALQTVLDDHGTDSSITVDSSYLPAGNYSILVTATNFLGGNSTSVAEIEVRSQAVPSLTIPGQSSYTILRSDAFDSVYAEATITYCNNETSTDGISYSWEVEEDSSISSYSAYPRAFKVKAYTFDFGSYTLTCTSIASNGGSSAASIQLTVEEAPLNAEIAGAAVRTVSLSGAVGLDGSGSSDLNEKDGTLTSSTSLTWSCLDSNGSAVCSFLSGGATGDYLNLTGIGLQSGESYYFTLKLEDGSRSSNATVQINVISDPIPETLVETKDSSIVLSKVDPSSIFILKGAVQFDENSAYTRGTTLWSAVEEDSSTFVSSDSLDEVSASGLSLTFTKGVSSTHYLVIPANKMVAGGTYTFQFDAAYLGSASAGTSQITVTCNEPPYSGSLTVDPTSGQSLVDTFDLTSKGWSDDADDFPLRYNFFYYDEDNDDRVVVLRVYGYANALSGVDLVEGFGANSSLRLGTTAQDAPGATGEAAVSRAAVAAYAAPLAAAGAAAGARISQAVAEADAEALHSVLRAYSVYLAAPNCTLAPDCAALNREGCPTGAVDHSCGGCLEGYGGGGGGACVPAGGGPGCTNGVQDGNETGVDCGGRCGPTCPAGGGCLGDGDCALGRCAVGEGVCVAPAKVCGNNCTGRGECRYYGPTGLAVEECLADDTYCEAVCSCDEGWYGDYCGLDEEALSIKQDITNELVDGLLSSLDISDTDSDALDLTAATLQSLSLNLAIMAGSSQIQMLNMTTSLVNSSLATGVEPTATFAENGLDVLDKMFSAPTLAADTGRLGRLSGGVSGLAAGTMATLVAGQEPQPVASGRVAYAAQVLDFSSVNFSSFLEAPGTEDYGNDGAVEADVGNSLSGQTSVGISLVSMSFNPYSSLSTSSTNISSPVGRLRVDNLDKLVASGKNFSFEMALSNYYAQSYSIANTSKVMVNCITGDYGTYTIACGSSNISHTCPGDRSSVFSYNCTSAATVPGCVVWDGQDWNDEMCTVKKASSTETVCTCTYDSQAYARRSLIGRPAYSSADPNDFNVATHVRSIHGEFASNFDSFATPFNDPSAVAENWVIFTVMGCMFVLGPCLIAFSTAFRWSSAFIIAFILGTKKQKKANNQSEFHKKYSSARLVSENSVFSSFDEEEHNSDGNVVRSSCGKRIHLRLYGKNQRAELFWSKWVEESVWLQLLQHSETIQKRIQDMVVLLAFLFTLMCWDATLTPVLSGDGSSSSASENMFPTLDPACGGHTTRLRCNARMFTGCYWDVNEQTCLSSEESVEGVTITLYCSVLSIILTTPMLILVEFILGKTMYLPYPKKMAGQEGGSHGDEEETESRKDSLASKLCCCLYKQGKRNGLSAMHCLSVAPTIPSRRPCHPRTNGDTNSQNSTTVSFDDSKTASEDSPLHLTGGGTTMQVKQEEEAFAGNKDTPSMPIGGPVPEILDLQLLDMSEQGMIDHNEEMKGPLEGGIGNNASHESNHRPGEEEVRPSKRTLSKNRLSSFSLQKKKLTSALSDRNMSFGSITTSLLKRAISDPSLTHDIELDETHAHEIALAEKVQIVMHEQRQFLEKQRVVGRFASCKRLLPNWMVPLTSANEDSIRQHAVRALALEAQIKTFVAQDDFIAAEALLLKQAHWDYLDSHEKRAIKRLTNALSEIYRHEEKEADTDTGLTYQQIKTRHVIGHIFVICYLFITSYYVCLFGINYGAEYTNQWLGSFFVALTQEIAAYIPLRVLVLYCVLPSIVANPRMHVQRLGQLQPRSPSWQVARSCPELAASQLIMSWTESPNTGTSSTRQLRIMFGARLSEHYFVGQGDKSQLTLHRSWQKFKSLILAVICLPLLYLPALLAETALDSFIAIGTNYFTLFSYVAYLASGIQLQTFASCYWLFYLLILTVLFFATQPRQRKALFGHMMCCKKGRK